MNGRNQRTTDRALGPSPLQSGVALSPHVLSSRLSYRTGHEFGPGASGCGRKLAAASPAIRVRPTAAPARSCRLTLRSYAEYTQVPRIPEPDFDGVRRSQLCCL